MKVPSDHAPCLVRLGGALVVLAVFVIATVLIWLGQRTGIDFYASTLAWAALLLWIVAMIGGVSYRLIRHFAKPS